MCFIRAVGEHFCAYAVGEKRSGSLAEYAAVVQNAHFPEVGIGIQFMLAAGYGQDEANAACDGIIEGIIRCGIAGMEGDHHVNGFAHVVFRYISCDEMKLIIAVFLRKPVAEGDNILLEVKPRHAHGDVLYLGEIVVNDEGQVRFSAAEIYDISSLSPRPSPRIQSSIHSRKRLICLNLSYISLRTAPEGVMTPISTRGGTTVLSGRR